MPMEWLKGEYRSMARENQVDFLGHMNNVAYVQIFEDARWEMITARGYGFEKIRAEGLGPVVLGIDLQYKREILLRETFIVRSWVQSYEGKICKLRQELLKEGEILACSADFTMGLFDMLQRKLVLPSPAWLTACGRI